MIGPRKKKMPDKKTCIGCDVLVARGLGGTKRFPKKWTVYYCKHPDLESQIACIGRNRPWTPAWCPALKKNLTAHAADRRKSAAD